MEFSNGSVKKANTPDAKGNPATTEWQLISGNPPLTTSDSVADDETETPTQYVMPRIDSDLETDDELGIRGHTHVSVEKLNATSMEYDRIEAEIQKMAQNELRMDRQISSDQKNFRRQIKQ